MHEDASSEEYQFSCSSIQPRPEASSNELRFRSIREQLTPTTEKVDFQTQFSGKHPAPSIVALNWIRRYKAGTYELQTIAVYHHNGVNSCCARSSGTNLEQESKHHKGYRAGRGREASASRSGDLSVLGGCEAARGSHR
jgi:hypothetical protein